MNHYQQKKLKELIDSESANAAKTDQEVFDWLTEKVVTQPKSEKQTVTSILHELGVDQGYSIINAVSVAAQADAKIKFILDLMQPSQGGIDLSHSESVAFIDQLQAASVLTLDQADKLKSVGNYMISRTEDAGLRNVTIDLVSKIRI